MARSQRPAGEVVPSCGWFGQEYKRVWRSSSTAIVGLWTKPRWARQDLRQHLRRIRRGA